MILDSDLELQLDEWARWVEKCTVGWTKESPIVKLLQGGFGAKSFKTASIPLESNPRAERVNSAIIELSTLDEQCADALKAYYLCRHVSAKDISKAIGVPKSTFMGWVKMAKIWLSGKLS